MIILLIGIFQTITLQMTTYYEALGFSVAMMFPNPTDDVVFTDYIDGFAKGYYDVGMGLGLEEGQKDIVTSRFPNPWGTPGSWARMSFYLDGYIAGWQAGERIGGACPDLPTISLTRD